MLNIVVFRTALSLRPLFMNISVMSPFLSGQHSSVLTISPKPIPQLNHLPHSSTVTLVSRYIQPNRHQRCHPCKTPWLRVFSKLANNGLEECITQSALPQIPEISQTASATGRACHSDGSSCNYPHGDTARWCKDCRADFEVTLEEWPVHLRNERVHVTQSEEHVFRYTADVAE